MNVLQLRRIITRVSLILLMNEKFLVRALSLTSSLHNLNSDLINSLADLIRNINDPEHPLTLEELHVLEESRVTVDNEKGEVFVTFTPTIPVISEAIVVVMKFI